MAEAQVQVPALVDIRDMIKVIAANAEVVGVVSYIQPWEIDKLIEAAQKMKQTRDQYDARRRKQFAKPKPDREVNMTEH